VPGHKNALSGLQRSVSAHPVHLATASMQFHAVCKEEACMPVPSSARQHQGGAPAAGGALAQATPSPEGSSMGPNEVRSPSAALAHALHGSAWSAGGSEHIALTLSAVQVTAESIEKISAYASDEDKFSPGGR